MEESYLDCITVHVLVCILDLVVLALVGGMYALEGEVLLGEGKHVARFSGARPQQRFCTRQLAVATQGVDARLGVFLVVVSRKPGPERGP